MAHMRDKANKHVGKWVQLHTKSGKYIARIEKVQSRGVIVRVPARYTMSGPIRSVPQNVVDKIQSEQYGYYRGGYGGYYGGGWWWWWIPWFWVIGLAALLWW